MRHLSFRWSHDTFNRSKVTHGNHGFSAVINQPPAIVVYCIPF